MLRYLKKIAKEALHARGYNVWNHVSFGHDPVSDLQKLCRFQQRSMKVVLDIGAHEGGSTENFKRTFPASKFHCFEPDDRSFQKLKAKFDKNPNITINQIALSDAQSKRQFYVYDNACINSLVLDAPFAEVYDQNYTVIEVDTNTVDQYCEENGIETISLLKIDTEEHEPAVLQGEKKDAEFQRHPLHLCRIQ
jgi:FkbM family methyltransferase